MFRKAVDVDLAALRNLERVANLAALSHVFPPASYPFPDDDVLARWRLVMDDPEATVVVAEQPVGIVAVGAYDDRTIRHLAVHPDHWGEGLASALIELALREMDLRGVTEASLWCLEENHRARRLYEYLGWRASGETQQAAWPPHPTELRYTRLIVASER